MAGAWDVVETKPAPGPWDVVSHAQPGTTFEPDPMLRTDPNQPQTAVVAPAPPPFDPGALTRTVEAAREGWEAGSHPLAPAAEAAVNEGGPVGRWLVNPFARLVTGVPAAIFRGGQQAVLETVGQVTGQPQLGRDIAAIPEALAGTPHLLPTPPAAVREAPPPPRFVQEHFGEGTRVNPLAAEPQAPAPAFVPPEAVRPPAVPINEPPTGPRPDVFVPPTEQAVPPGELGPRPANAPMGPNAFAPPEAPPAGPEIRVRQPGAPADLSGTDQQWLAGLGRDVQEVLRENGATTLGAMATPEEAARMTPAQMKANRRMAELGEILAPPAAGEDLQIHVPGSEPTLAERSGDPRVSQVETVARQRAPERFDPRLTANSQARIRQFDNMSGSDPQLVTLGEQQAAAAQADTARIMRTAHDADATPLLKYYDDLLNDPRIRERDDVVKILKPLRDALFDETGQLKTDPQSFWGMHDNLMARLAKAKDPLQASSAEKFAFDQLLGAKKATDAVMNGATDGAFQTFLDNQASFFQRKNAMEVLQKFRTKLVDPKTGHIYADRFHRWLADLAVRRGKPGVDAAMDLPDEVMRGLIDIDNDLKRASRIDLGKARGSPTNLFFEVAKAAGIAGAHTVAGFTTGGVGNVAIQLAQPTVARWNLNRLVNRHLAPPPEGFRPNPFAPPP